jgi:hypothetical protein
MAGTILNSRIARFAIVTVAAMAALVILWFTVLPPIIEQQIIRALVAQGFAEADIRLSQLSLNHATLENLTLGTESGFSVSEIKISYTIASLLRSEVSSIILIGFRSDIAYQDRVWDLGPFDAFIGAGDSMGVQTQAVVLPFDRVELRDARIHFDWQDREFLLPFSAELNRAGEHDIDLGLRASLEGASITINGGANLDSLRGRAEIDISQLPARLICQLGESSLQEHQVSSSGELNIAGDVRFPDTGGRAGT